MRIPTKMLAIWQTMCGVYQMLVNIKFITNHHHHLGCYLGTLVSLALHVELSTVTRTVSFENGINAPIYIVFSSFFCKVIVATERTEGKSHVNFLSEKPSLATYHTCCMPPCNCCCCCCC